MKANRKYLYTFQNLFQFMGLIIVAIQKTRSKIFVENGDRCSLEGTVRSNIGWGGGGCRANYPPGKLTAV